MPCRLADLVVHLREGILATELLAQLVVQGTVEHFPELLPVHVAVGIEHLESAEGEKPVRAQVGGIWRGGR